MKKWLVMAAVLGGILAVALSMALNRYDRFLEQPLAIPESGYVLLVPAGETGTGIVQRLVELGFTEPGWTWRLILKLNPRMFHAGEFRLEPGMIPIDVIDRLSSNQVVGYRFTIVEGWNFSELLDRLSTDPVLARELPADRAEAWSMVNETLGFEHPEGWFLPETYVFTRGDSDLDILRRAHESMQTALAEAWAARSDGLPLESPYELLTLASIIEKETALDEEREQVSGVFIRRLKSGMRLQTDPTVIYGIGPDFDGDIRRSDLKTDTPYNTYTRHGLPPTPIALPGRASLFSAGSPDAGTALYFVADGKGGHTFSDTLEQHQAAVRRYLGKRG